MRNFLRVVEHAAIALVCASIASAVGTYRGPVPRKPAPNCDAEQREYKVKQDAVAALSKEEAAERKSFDEMLKSWRRSARTIESTRTIATSVSRENRNVRFRRTAS